MSTQQRHSHRPRSGGYILYKGIRWHPADRFVIKHCIHCAARLRVPDDVSESTLYCGRCSDPDRFPAHTPESLLLRAIFGDIGADCPRCQAQIKLRGLLDEILKNREDATPE